MAAVKRTREHAEPVIPAAAEQPPALVCKVCGERIESLSVSDGREVLDLVTFQERHAACLAKSSRP